MFGYDESWYTLSKNFVKHCLSYWVKVIIFKTYLEEHVLYVLS